MTKKEKKKGRAFETRKRLYATAEALFTRYGFDNVSVDRIVEEAGLAKGTFYVHFKTKDDLLTSLISDYVRKVDMDYQAFIDTFSPDVLAADMLLHLAEKIMDVIIGTIGLERMKTLYRAQLTNISYSTRLQAINGCYIKRSWMCWTRNAKRRVCHRAVVRGTSESFNLIHAD